MIVQHLKQSNILQVRMQRCWDHKFQKIKSKNRPAVQRAARMRTVLFSPKQMCISMDIFVEIKPRATSQTATLQEAKARLTIFQKMVNKESPLLAIIQLKMHIKLATMLPKSIIATNLPYISRTLTQQGLQITPHPQAFHGELALLQLQSSYKVNPVQSH